MPDSLWPHEPQHVRPPCPSPTPRVYPNPCPSRRWYHPTISSAVIPFSSRLQSYPVSGSFPMSQVFTSGGQSTGVSASASVLPMNPQDWSPLGWTGWISCSPRDSQESTPTPQLKSINSSALSFLSSQGYGLSNSYVWIWELDYKESWAPWTNDAFELWCWRRLLRAPCTARRSNQSILKEISPEYSVEELMLNLKLQYFGHLWRRTDSLEKTLMVGKIEGRREGDDRGCNG